MDTDTTLDLHNILAIMNEPFSDELLSAYLDGDASPTERERVEQWLAESDDHVRMLADLRLLGSDLRALPRPVLDVNLRDRVLASIEQQSTTHPASEARKNGFSPDGFAPIIAQGPVRSLPLWQWFSAGIAATLLIGMISLASLQTRSDRQLTEAAPRASAPTPSAAPLFDPQDGVSIGSPAPGAPELRPLRKAGELPQVLTESDKPGSFGLHFGDSDAMSRQMADAAPRGTEFVAQLLQSASDASEGEVLEVYLTTAAPQADRSWFVSQSASQLNASRPGQTLGRSSAQSQEKSENEAAPESPEPQAKRGIDNKPADAAPTNDVKSTEALLRDNAFAAKDAGPQDYAMKRNGGLSRSVAADDKTARDESAGIGAMEKSVVDKSLSKQDIAAEELKSDPAASEGSAIPFRADEFVELEATAGDLLQLFSDYQTRQPASRLLGAQLVPAAEANWNEELATKRQQQVPRGLKSATLADRRPSTRAAKPVEPVELTEERADGAPLAAAAKPTPSAPTALGAEAGKAESRPAAQPAENGVAASAPSPAPAGGLASPPAPGAAEISVPELAKMAPSPVVPPAAGAKKMDVEESFQTVPSKQEKEAGAENDSSQLSEALRQPLVNRRQDLSQNERLQHSLQQNEAPLNQSPLNQSPLNRSLRVRLYFVPPDGSATPPAEAKSSP